MCKNKNPCYNDYLARVNMTKKSSLDPESIRFIEREKGRMSSRQIAKQLGLSRNTVEAYLDKNSAGPENIQEIKKPAVLYLGIIALFVGIAFFNSLHFDFIWDDHTMIVKDTSIESLSTLPKALVKPLGYYGSETGSLWRPIATLTFFIDTQIAGKKPFVFHVTNTILHAITACLIFLFLRRLFKSDVWAFCAAMLYAVHPVNVEPIVSINGRHSPLMAIFLLAGFLAHRSRFSWLTPACLLLSFYSRETAVMAPFALIAYDYFVLNEKDLSFKSMFKKYFSYFLVLGIYFLTRFWVLGGLGTAASGDTQSGYYTWQNRFWIQPVNFAEYFKMIFFPVDLHFWRQLYFPRNFFEPAYFFPFLSLTVFFAAGYVAFRKSAVAFFGFVFFLIFLFPVSNLLIVINSPVLDHWLYTPLIGFLIFFIGLLRELFIKNSNFRNRLCQGFFLLATAGILLPMTLSQNKVWTNEKIFYEYTLKHVTRDPLLYSNLGAVYAREGNLEKAESLFRKALELDPEYPTAKKNLNLLLHRKNSSA